MNKLILLLAGGPVVGLKLPLYHQSYLLHLFSQKITS